MYSGLLSVPGTYFFHSLAYKYLYSVAKTSELRLLPLLLLCSPSRLSFPSPLRDLEDLSPTRLLIIIYLLLVSGSGNSGVRNSHAHSHSEIRDP